MTSWTEFWALPLVHRTGWALLHFLWQGAALAGLWAGLRYALRQQPALWRYRVGCALFLLLISLPILNFLATPAAGAASFPGGPPTLSAATAAPGWPWIATTTPAPGSVALFSRAAENLAASVERVLPALVALWVAGVLLCAVRLFRGCWSVRQLARCGLEPVEAAWQARLAQLQRRLAVKRPVRLLVSTLLQVPTVVGWLRPVILLPASSLAGLTPAQLELILAHELAHLRRHDHWVNLLQVLAETVWFYHPAVWWLSRDLRHERELCCDDLAVAACGDRLAYARALTELEALRSTAPALALSATGGSLLQRIRHVLGLPAPGALNWRLPTGNALLGLGLLLFACGLVCLALSPKEYVAACKVLLRPSDAHASANGTPSLYDPYFVQTEFEQATSMKVLQQVVERLRLTERWRGEGGPLPIGSAAARLRRHFAVQQLGGSSVMELRAWAKSPTEAAELANALAEAYRATRSQGRQDAHQAGLKTLEDAYRESQHRAALLQEQVQKLREDLQVPESLTEESAAGGGLTAETLRRLAGERVAAETQARGMQELLTRLRELQTQGEDALTRAIPNILPDADLSKLLQDQWAAEATLSKLRVTFAKDHPDVRSLEAMRADLVQKVRDRVEGMMTGLAVRLAAKQSEAKSLMLAMEDARQLEAQRAAKYRPYFELRRSLEDSQRISASIQLRLLQEAVDAKIPVSVDFAIIEQAVPAERVVYRWLGLALWLCAAGTTSGFAGAALRWTARHRPLTPAMA